MLPLLVVLAFCTRVVSSAECNNGGDNGFNGNMGGTAETCACGTPPSTTCKNMKEGCNAVAKTCVCPEGSAWGEVDQTGVFQCIVCGPYDSAENQKTMNSRLAYTMGYKCAGGSNTVVGDGKTICPVGTVDRRSCDNTHCQKTGTTACTACANGQYQDEEGQGYIWNGPFSTDTQWYVKHVYFFFSSSSSSSPPPPSSFSFSLSYTIVSHTLTI